MCSKLFYRACCALVTLCIACTQAPQGEATPQAQIAEPARGVEPQPDPIGSAQAQPERTRPAPLPLPESVVKASESVVRVVSYVGRSGTEAVGFPYAGLAEHKRGLGVVIEEAGFILTTYSLLARDGSAELPAVVDVQGLDEGSPHIRAAIVGMEPTLDLAILQAKLDGVVTSARLEVPDLVEAGTPLFAVTGRREQSLTHVSGTIAELPSAECYQHSMTPTMLQVSLDQPLETLGSPVFGASGKLLAFKTRHEGQANEAKTESITHLLPIELVLNIYEALKTKRSTRSPWTGFSVRALSVGEQGMFPVQGFKGGIALLDIWANSPAERMELNPGDILLAFGHYRIGSVADFQKWLYMHGVGQKVTLTFLRGGAIIERAYTIEERPSWAVPR